MVMIMWLKCRRAEMAFLFRACPRWFFGWRRGPRRNFKERDAAWEDDFLLAVVSLDEIGLI